jgi:flagellar biosynthesis protein FlhA
MNTIAKLFKHTDLMLGAGMLLIVAMLVLPLPTWALDAGLVVAIASSVIILLSAVNVTDPLQFSVFPSLLLISTLFRLALSIAATKLILGGGNAGQVIETFGTFIMGGDFVVGFVAFLILVIVQFIVITNGAGRVAEVVARFTLDALPGKQMAIDADLAAGAITEEDARLRRKKIKLEADFYGAMDGASKFVKGDAIASILIIIINVVGGFTDAMTILRTYALLSVGEGLVSQLPALLISTASGLIVTRAGQERSMGGEVASQILGQPRAIGFAGIALAGLGLVPGFPTIIFMSVGGLLLGLYRFLDKTPNLTKLLATGTKGAQAEQDEQPKAPQLPTGPEAVLPLLTVDPIEIEIGYALTRLADPRTGGDLTERITATRRQIALELGFVMPTVRVRDSIHLNPTAYILKIRGEEVAKGEAHVGQCLAVNSGAVINPVTGTPTKDPVFGLDAVWIDNSLRESAERGGYTVIEAAAVLSTHLAEVVKAHASELLSRQDVQTLLDNAKTINETVVTELVPNVLQVGEIQKVLQHLLQERVPIRDMVTILETMADFGARVKDPDQLGELVRSSIARTITRQYVDQENRVFCITLEPMLEHSLIESLNVTTFGSTLMLEPQEQRRIIAGLEEQMNKALAEGYQPVLLCGNQLRLPLHRLVSKYMSGLNVLAYNEIAAKADVEFVGQVKAA